MRGDIADGADAAARALRCRRRPRDGDRRSRRFHQSRDAHQGRAGGGRRCVADAGRADARAGAGAEARHAGAEPRLADIVQGRRGGEGRRQWPAGGRDGAGAAGLCGRTAEPGRAGRKARRRSRCTPAARVNRAGPRWPSRRWRRWWRRTGAARRAAAARSATARLRAAAGPHGVRQSGNLRRARSRSPARSAISSSRTHSSRRCGRSRLPMAASRWRWSRGPIPHDHPDAAGAAEALDRPQLAGHRSRPTHRARPDHARSRATESDEAEKAAAHQDPLVAAILEKFPGADVCRVTSARNRCRSRPTRTPIPRRRRGDDE